MLFAHLCAADACALQAALINQLRSECAFRALERAARAEEGQRLLFGAAAVEVHHFRKQVFALTRRQLDGDVRNNLVFLHQARKTVAEMQVRAAVTERFTRHVVALNQRHHLTHFAAVRARVHVHAAANRPRNAAGEGQSAKVAVRRRH